MHLGVPAKAADVALASGGYAVIQAIIARHLLGALLHLLAAGRPEVRHRQILLQALEYAPLACGGVAAQGLRHLRGLEILAGLWCRVVKDQQVSGYSLMAEESGLPGTRGLKSGYPRGWGLSSLQYLG